MCVAMRTLLSNGGAAEDETDAEGGDAELLGARVFFSFIDA